MQSVSNASNLRVNLYIKSDDGEHPGYSFTAVCAFRLTSKVTEGGKDVHVLIITDHFTRYAQSLVTSSQAAKCTVQVLWE